MRAGSTLHLPEQDNVEVRLRTLDKEGAGIPLKLYGNSVGVISIESQRAAILAKGASRELSPDNQPPPKSVKTATPNISGHRQLSRTKRRTPDGGKFVLGS